MNPLTLDDLLPLEEYIPRRAEFFAAHVTYRDRYRRIRVGPKLTLLFENRQTLWFRVQEVLSVARLTEPALIEALLNGYNRLLPGRDRLQAALVLDVDTSRWAEETKFWAGLAGEAIRLVMEPVSVPGRLVTARPEDRAAGTAHWLEFALAPADRVALADFKRPAQFVVSHPGYDHTSAYLNDEMRQSLLDDLAVSHASANAA